MEILIIRRVAMDLERVNLDFHHASQKSPQTHKRNNQYKAHLITLYRKEGR